MSDDYHIVDQNQLLAVRVLEDLLDDAAAPDELGVPDVQFHALGEVKHSSNNERDSSLPAELVPVVVVDLPHEELRVHCLYLVIQQPEVGGSAANERYLSMRLSSALQ